MAKEFEFIIKEWGERPFMKYLARQWRARFLMDPSSPPQRNASQNENFQEANVNMKN